MRNPDRLDFFYDRLKLIHKRYFPDWRFGQLMYNFLRTCDPFYFEEEEFLEKINDYAKTDGLQIPIQKITEEDKEANYIFLLEENAKLKQINSKLMDKIKEGRIKL